jgi:hypothetical protein
LVGRRYFRHWRSSAGSTTRKSQSKYGTALSYRVLECDHTHAWYRTRLGAVKPEMAIAAAIRLQQLGIAASA